MPRYVAGVSSYLRSGAHSQPESRIVVVREDANPNDLAANIERETPRARLYSTNVPGSARCDRKATRPDRARGLFVPVVRLYLEVKRKPSSSSHPARSGTALKGALLRAGAGPTEPSPDARADRTEPRRWPSHTRTHTDMYTCARVLWLDSLQKPKTIINMCIISVNKTKNKSAQTEKGKLILFRFKWENNKVCSNKVGGMP